MRYVCDAPGGKAWFRIETEAEALRESRDLDHAVDKYFRRFHEAAVESYIPPSGSFIERDIGLKDHVSRDMPVFLTLRDGEGNGLATAMLPPDGPSSIAVSTIVVGPGNRDPYPEHEDAIEALAERYGIRLDRQSCFPYARR